MLLPYHNRLLSINSLTTLSQLPSGLCSTCWPSTRDTLSFTKILYSDKMHTQTLYQLSLVVIAALGASACKLGMIDDAPRKPVLTRLIMKHPGMRE